MDLGQLRDVRVHPSVTSILVDNVERVRSH
jgi:hypothetical protein